MCVDGLPSTCLLACIRTSTCLRTSAPILVPRYLLYNVSNEVESYSLHGFCDASLRAYAAVVYLRVKTRTGYSVTFLASKTRVTPLREQTIPRLELLSALLLARLITSVKESLAQDYPCQIQPATYGRPKRAAALKARERVKQWTCEDNY